MRPIVTSLVAMGMALTGVGQAIGQQPASRTLVAVDWPATWTPQTSLRVWFEDVGSDYRQMVWDAFAAWRSDELPLTVRPARSPAEANVLVAEAAHPLDPSARLGETTIRGWGRTISGAIVRLSRVDHDGRPIPRSIRKKTTFHEIGHVLGLGHAPEGRIMHAVLGESGITDLDLADLRALYGTPRGIVVGAALAPFPMPQE